MKTIVINSPKYGRKEVFVDDEDFELVSKYHWNISRQRKKDMFYAVSRTSRKLGKRKSIVMHRIIMGVTDPKVLVDHRFHNTLDNRKSQLRICNNSENHKNAKPKGTSKYLGVSWSKSSKKWIAMIVIDSKQKYLGQFPATACGELLAALTYDIWALKHHGEFANPNFK